MIHRLHFASPGDPENRSATSLLAVVTFVALTILVLSGRVAMSQDDSLRRDSALTGFIANHCVNCHGDFLQEATLRLDALPTDFTDSGQFSTWVKVLDRVSAGEMPPPDAEQPSIAERREFVQHLAEQLRRADRQRQRSEGRVRLRRLTRVEYENTLRDLLALPTLDVKEMLPPDNSAQGFDNVADAQDISYVQMARYLAAANVTLDRAMSLEPRPETTSWHDTLPEGNHLVATRIRQGREAVRVAEAVALLRQPKPAQTAWTWRTFQPHAEGLYHVRMKTFGVFWDKDHALPADRPHVITLYAKQGHEKRWLAAFDVTGQPEVAEASVWLRPGEVVETYLATLQLRNAMSVEKYTGPGIAFEWLEAEGPLFEQWPPHSRQLLFGDLPVDVWTADSGFTQPPPKMRVTGSDKRAQLVPDLDSPRSMVVSDDPRADAKQLLRAFMERAFRRPVPLGEVDRYLPLVQQKLDEHLCFQKAMRIGYQAVLCSPDLLFFHEQPGRLDDFALASRLSYFLWVSMPDQELLSLAACGELNRPRTLHDQVERMLDDPRSTRFIEDFLGQWLDIREITITQPDQRLYPEFDQLLLDSIVWETHAYFREMLKHDLGASHLVDSDFAMLNERLAQHYDIPGVEGVDIRRVDLPPNSPRGGFLTQASVLKVTANGTTTSPVTRGAWVLDRLLGQPVPPPPPNVPAIEPDLRGAVTIREQLHKHREVESCASCHKRIDPPGFALESFDVIGGWRDRYRTLEGEAVNAVSRSGKPVDYRLGPPVDASGTAPGGEPFEEIDGFRRILLNNEEQLARSLVERLLIYATGAEIQFADRQVVEGILNHSRKSGYGLRTLIHAVVQSETFQSK